MRVIWKNNQLIVEPRNVILVNYPLNWIEGIAEQKINQISKFLFNDNYNNIEFWKFVSQRVATPTRTIKFKKRSYKNWHVDSQGELVGEYNGNSRIWRGVYDPDLGRYGRLGGARKTKIGAGSHERCLRFQDSFGNIKRFYAKDTSDQLIQASINLVFPWTILVPPPQITLDFLEQKGIKVIFSLAGPRGGQPLSKHTVGVGRLSKLGSLWYNYPNRYVNDRYAPGEVFDLMEQLKLANMHPAVVAILQQDEPVITDIYKQRYNFIKQHSEKPVFCTYNWGAFYNASSLRYRAIRNQRISAVASVTDIYSSDPYIYDPCTDCFGKFGDPKSNVWRLVDRHKSEIAILSRVTKGDFQKPIWITLQGYGERDSVNPISSTLPDPDFMFAQIWTAICLGATGVFVYFQHNPSSDVSNLINKQKNKYYRCIEGIAPDGPNGESWHAMARAFNLIKKFEKILLTETIEVSLCDNNRILTMIKEFGHEYYIFAQNTYRNIERGEFALDIFPGNAWYYKDLIDSGCTGKTRGGVTLKFSSFQLRILHIKRI